MEPGASAGESSTSKWLGAAAVLLAVASLVGLGFWLGSEPGQGTVPPDAAPSIAVLPLRNASPDPEDSDYLAEGISQAVITKLTQAGLRVTPWQTVMRYRSSTEPPEAIARELGADTVLVGTFQLDNERILTTLSLVEAETGFQSWADEFEEPFQDLFSVQRRIALGAATRLKSRLTGKEEELLALPESRSVEAYDYFLQGAHLRQEGTEESNDVALQFFRQALELDPHLAEAQVGIGTVQTDRFFNGWAGGVTNLDEAEASYQRALETDPDSVAARRGLILVNWERGNSEAVLREGERVGRSGRDDVETLLARGDAYFFGGLPDKAVTYYQQVLALDPTNEDAQWHVTSACFYERELELAVEYGTSYLDRFGDDEEIHFVVGASLHLLGEGEPAADHYRKALQLSSEEGGGSPVSVTGAKMRAFLAAGHLASQQGKIEEARDLWRRGAELIESELGSFPDNTRMQLLLACFYGLLGDDARFAREQRRALDRPVVSSVELRNLAATHAALGDYERAVAILRRQIEDGRLDGSWIVYLELAGVRPAGTAFEPLVREFESARVRFSERY